MAEQLKVIIDADVSKAVAGIQTLSKVITADFSKAAQTASATAQSLTKSIDLLKTEFQSIGKINIDSSDLNKIQAKLDSIKVKPLTLDFELKGQSEVDAAIQSIRTKFESLKFNPDLSVFNEIVAEINKLKSNDILLHIDNSEALSAVNQIQSSLNSIKGDIIITGNVDQAIAGIKEKIAALRTIDLKADPSQAILAIDKIISEITKIKDTDVLLRADNSGALKAVNQLESQLKDIRANVVINTTGFEAAKKNVLDIDKAFGEATTRIDSLIDKMVADALGGTDKIKSSFGDLGAVSLDSKQALAAIDQLEAKLDALQLKVPITVTAEGLQKLNADIEKTKADLNSLVSKNIKVDVDATAALQKVGTLRAQLQTISNVPFKFDTANAIQGITNLQSKVHNLDSSLKTVSGLNAFQSALGKSTAAVKSLQATGTGLNNFYNNLSSASNRAAASLSKVPNATNTASFALLNFGRVVQDAPFGILGIANNLNPLIESLQRASAAAKATGTSLGKNLLGALGGAGGIGFAVSAISSLLIVFGDRLFGAGKKASVAASEVKSFGEVVAESTGSVQGDLAKVNALVKAATDSANGLQIQKRAIEELQKINKSYFGELTAGKSTYEEIAKAANAYTEALVNQAVISGLSNAISKLSEEYGNLFIKYQDQTKAANAARVELNKTIAANRTVVQGVTGQNQAVNSATNSFNSLQGELGLTGKELAKISTRINEFTSQIQSAINVQLKLKPLDVSKIGPDKNQTDDILARARQFVKEFGDVFVLPDLEETFFKGKKQLLPIAEKLLDDLAKKKLQLKIPVETELVQVNKTEDILDEVTGQFKKVTKTLHIKVPVITELDFLPEIKGAALTKEQLENLTDNFFKGLKIEKGIDIEFVPEFSISPDATKQFDKLQDDFIKLGERGKAAFAAISFGTKDGTNQLAAFNDGLKKAQEELKKLLGQPDRKLNFQVAVEFAQIKSGDKDKAGNDILKDLSNSAKEAALTINDTLAPAFENMFDAILQNKNPLKAFFDSIKQAIEQVIKKLIAAAIQAIILSAITKGASGSFGSIFTNLLGVSKGGQASNFGLGGAIGSRSFQNTLQVVVSGAISGDTIRLAGQRAAISSQRGG